MGRAKRKRKAAMRRKQVRHVARVFAAALTHPTISGLFARWAFESAQAVIAEREASKEVPGCSYHVIDLHGCTACDRKNGRSK